MGFGSPHQQEQNSMEAGEGKYHIRGKNDQEMVNRLLERK